METECPSTHDTPFPELARQVKNILLRAGPNGAPLSARGAAALSGVSAATINSMLKGFRPSAANLRKFADAFHASSFPLLVAAGYVSEAPADQQPGEPLVRIANPDEATILARYRHLPPEKQRMARRLLDALSEDDNDEGDILGEDPTGE